MKNNNKKKNIDYKAIGLWGILVIAIIIFIIFLFNTFSNNSISNSVITDAMKNKKDLVVYVENSNSNKCKNCGKIKDYLDSKKIKYELYDINSVSDSEYKSLLKNLDIDSELFGTPAVIYISNGMMFANIINIEDTSVVEQFIKDYNLK